MNKNINSRSVRSGLERLCALNAIHTTKARYWRGIDTKDIALLRSVFAEDVRIDFRDALGRREGAGGLWEGREPYLAHAGAALRDLQTIHHGFIPEFTWTEDDEVRAIWPMEDLVISTKTRDAPFRRLRGWGYYHDVFRRVGDRWLIAEMRLERVRLEFDTSES